MAGRLSRRSMLIQMAVAGSAALLAACQTAAPTAPPVPTAPPASTTAPAAAAAGPAPGAAAWQQVIEAAKREGKVSVNTYPGSGIQAHFQNFMAAYPAISVEQTTLNAASFAPRVVQERKASIFTWDVAQMPTTTALSVLQPAGVFDPIKTAIIAPEVTDDTVWRDGFAYGFHLTNDQQLCYAFTLMRNTSVWLNTDRMKLDEFKTVQDLLKPELKGKVVWADPRSAGNSITPLTFARLSAGDGIVKQLLIDQDPVLAADGVQAGQMLVRGNFTAGVGVDLPIIQDFQNQGVARNLAPAYLPEMQGAGSGMPLWLVNQGPHPNAAKVLINWWLGKEGQESWVKNTQQNSRRTDVPVGNPDQVVPPGNTLPDANEEHFIPELTKTQELAKQLIK